ncbi:hypothetical protein MMC14_000784 [Varicellaria rhodocarpa]|nr:hypothetical protein [Varicellaria rhodocarpa]
MFTPFTVSSSDNSQSEPSSPQKLAESLIEQESYPQIQEYSGGESIGENHSLIYPTDQNTAKEKAVLDYNVIDNEPQTDSTDAVFRCPDCSRLCWWCETSKFATSPLHQSREDNDEDMPYKSSQPSRTSTNRLIGEGFCGPNDLKFKNILNEAGVHIEDEDTYETEGIPNEQHDTEI